MEDMQAARFAREAEEGENSSAGDTSHETKTHFRVCRFIIETVLHWKRTNIHSLDKSSGTPGHSTNRDFNCIASKYKDFIMELVPPLQLEQLPPFLEGFPQYLGVKLGMRSVPVATACALYHKFFQSASLQVYEPYLVAMSCIYLAGKVEEQHLRTRDIINVCHRYFHPGSDPLELDGKFWELRDSVVQCELLILRQLNFQVSFEHPHKYLLHYLLSVRSLLNRHAWSRTPIAETAWALLKDSYHGPVCVRHQPQHLALTALYLALHTYGVQVPRGEREWWQVLCEDVTRAQIEGIMTELLQLYDMEAKCT